MAASPSFIVTVSMRMDTVVFSTTFASDNTIFCAGRMALLFSTMNFASISGVYCHLSTDTSARSSWAAFNNLLSATRMYSSGIAMSKRTNSSSSEIG